MAENTDSFRGELVKFANIVEILENTFIGKESVEVISYLDENNFKKLSNNLNSVQENKCVISMDKVNFIFLKK
jgi:hypothetical protein